LTANWTDAQAICTAEGAYLAIITSFEELITVSAISSTLASRWVGAQRQAGNRLTAPYTWTGSAIEVNSQFWAPATVNETAEPSRFTAAICVFQGFIFHKGGEKKQGISWGRAVGAFSLVNKKKKKR
jgi:hypothetical protein